MSEYLDYIAEVEDAKTIVNDLSFKMYQYGRVDAIEEFANIVLTELEYGAGGSIEDFIREYVKEQRNE